MNQPKINEGNIFDMVIKWALDWSRCVHITRLSVRESLKQLSAKMSCDGFSKRKHALCFTFLRIMHFE